ncbi:MAG: hypothetical protein WCW65_01065 [Candidatus Paceibacterota bacterium]
MKKNESIDWLVESGYKVHYQIKIYQIWKWKVSHYVLIKIISFIEIIFKKTNYDKQEYNVWKNSKQIMVLDRLGTLKFLYPNRKKRKEILKDIKNQRDLPKEPIVINKNAFEDFNQEIKNLRKKRIHQMQD